MEYQAFVSVRLWTVLIQAANLLLTTLLLRKFLMKPVLSIWNRRRSEVDGIYEKAEKEKNDAEDMRRLYAEKISWAKAEVEAIKQRAEDEIAQMKAAAADRAKGEAAHIRESALRQTEIERSRARASLQAETSAMAVEIARKMLMREINENDQEQLVRDFLENAEIEL